MKHPEEMPPEEVMSRLAPGTRKLVEAEPKADRLRLLSLAQNLVRNKPQFSLDEAVHEFLNSEVGY